MTKTHLLVVGLGNVPHPRTRHSVGHLVVDALATRLGIRISADKVLDGFAGHSHVALGGTTAEVTLFKPRPLMNISGPAVASALRHTAKHPSSMVVIHDSLEHKPKTLSPKFGGSANGHNGVRSVIAALGNPDFHRLRIGIGRDGDAASFVLGKLSSDESVYWDLGPGLDNVYAELTKIALRQPPDT